jgi:hypothetical protein
MCSYIFQTKINERAFFSPDYHDNQFNENSVKRPYGWIRIHDYKPKQKEDRKMKIKQAAKPWLEYQRTNSQKNSAKRSS